MKIAILTSAFLGEPEGYRCLKGELVGGAEIYLHTLIREVLEPVADGIVVFQKMGSSRRLSEKTSVITKKSLHSLDLNSFDLVLLNGFQSIVPEANPQKLEAASVAIHHGMHVPPALNQDTLKTYCEYAEVFSVSAKQLYRPTRLLFGEKAADVALRVLRVPLRMAVDERNRRCTRSIVARNSRMVDCVVSVDKDSLRYLCQSERAKWRVIYNFVDLELFNPRLPKKDVTDSTAILVPRNLTSDRGVFIIPKIVCLLKQSEYRVKFIVAGEGNLRAFLKREIARLDLKKEVILLGHQNHSVDMPHLYASSDIVLVPSFTSEGTSLAVLEGMASKKPVVTTDVGGINDIGLTGKHKLSSPFSVEMIARNIARLIEDKGLAERIAESGYEHVCLNHNMSLWKKKWQEVIAHATENTRGTKQPARADLR